MKVGQVYKIKFRDYNSSGDPTGHLKTVRAKLIFEGKHFYTFEYKSKMGDLLKATISKFEHEHNQRMIKEVENE